MIGFLNGGVLNLSFWGYVAVTFVMVQVSMIECDAAGFSYGEMFRSGQ